MRRAGPGNLTITDEDDHWHKELSEEYRREKVSKAVRAAFKDGRNTANAIRKNDATERKKLIVRENEAIIFGESLSDSATAARIIDQETNYGLGHRALRKVIGQIRRYARMKVEARARIRTAGRAK
jgi:hypothetical protein